MCYSWMQTSLYLLFSQISPELLVASVSFWGQISQMEASMNMPWIESIPFGTSLQPKYILEC